MNRVFFVSLALLLSTSCTSLVGSKPGPELGALLVKVSAEYLQHVVNADEARIGGAILWTDFLEQADIDKKEYMRQVRSLRKKRWTPAQHPLLGLTVEEITWYGDAAEIHFRKANSDKPYPLIKVEMVWAGSGWLVTKDNLFGKKLLVADWEADKNAFRS